MKKWKKLEKAIEEFAGKGKGDFEVVEGLLQEYLGEVQIEM